ncbi:MAG: acyl carrier protein [Thermodesulfobacteriota bacterium]|nr:acyl carrier protein [Thermodesulfobacteriota bacterium]
MTNEIKNKIVELIKALKNGEEFDVEEPLIESGLLDSFDMMNLIMKLGECFGVSIDGEDMTPENFSTVETIARMVNRLQK